MDVNGVGYEIQAPMSVFYSLPEIGNQVVLITHLAVREDAHVLYGFSSHAERELFRNVIKTNGIGPKLGLAILSGMEADQFARVVESEDVTALCKLPGVGKKTAERLIIEMRGKLSELGGGSDGSAPVAAAPSAKQEAEDALVALGYKPSDATKAVKAVISDEDLGSEELIRLALQNMVRK